MREVRSGNSLEDLLNQVRIGDVEDIVRWCNLYKSIAETLVYAVLRPELPAKNIQLGVLTDTARE